MLISKTYMAYPVTLGTAQAKPETPRTNISMNPPYAPTSPPPTQHIASMDPNTDPPKPQFHSHYDGRFAERILPNDLRRAHLTDLIRTYLSTMHSIGAETWIMHGSLLGWFWNRKIMPWDSDVDVQVSERSIAFLADYHNMTIHRFQVGDKGEGRNYMLEVNPHYKNADKSDYLNVIDARWIDMETGLFIDITALRKDRAAEEAGEQGRMMCKDQHNYLMSDIFPLRDSVFEGVSVKIPYNYAELLEEEYGATALTETEFENHRFDQQTLEWIPVQRKKYTS